MPRISIIVPVFRAEKYLHSCVDSILGQTFSDFEVFLVDDGSPDNCGAICEEYAQKDRRVRVIHQENRGQAAARNRALKEAAGEWVCFVDSDDLIHPQMVQRLYEAATAHDAGISMCAMLEAPSLPEHFYNAPGDVLEVLEMGEDTLVALYDREEYPAWVACAKLIRREYVEKYLFREGRIYEDNEAVCHWIVETPVLVRLPDALYFYRTNPESTTQRKFTEKKLDYLWALEQIIRFYGSVGYQKMKARFFERYALELINCGNAARYHLEKPELAKEIRSRGRRFASQQRLGFTLEQREQLLEAAYPKLMPMYWLLKGAICTLYQEGPAGLIRKIMKKSRGDSL